MTKNAKKILLKDAFEVMTAKEIRDYRIRLAMDHGVSERTVFRWSNSPITLEQLNQLYTFFKVTFDYKTRTFGRESYMLSPEEVDEFIDNIM